MTIGASIFLIAIGAILNFAVDDSIGGIDLPTVGVILMICGAIGLLLGLFMMNQASHRRVDYYDDAPPRPPVV